mmetsp:Transcript_15121/g.19866  ORF Transcript_15121/g.19866 Transcript_15121/m.19866 type:complete len:552 (+) Transcript_15121:274-1929(+)|eukprot:CAMPEP_0184024038 /NCGR_PEP_ID=MMETSP0954-20121128/11785_1 /TAXON_ID=627963 /ORGANISM="Aplanochytrium sp, Strain PBS07" /LENGTH=551 /DNA_ID=CAMNT_0026307171 /DNA_START=213 /DNA_END=1868 /DNA_ORIENTATION=+
MFKRFACFILFGCFFVIATYFYQLQKDLSLPGGPLSLVSQSLPIPTFVNDASNISDKKRTPPRRSKSTGAGSENTLSVTGLSIIFERQDEGREHFRGKNSYRNPEKQKNSTKSLVTGQTEEEYSILVESTVNRKEKRYGKEAYVEGTDVNVPGTSGLKESEKIKDCIKSNCKKALTTNMFMKEDLDKKVNNKARTRKTLQETAQGKSRSSEVSKDANEEEITYKKGSKTLPNGSRVWTNTKVSIRNSSTTEEGIKNNRVQAKSRRKALPVVDERGTKKNLDHTNLTLEEMANVRDKTGQRRRNLVFTSAGRDNNIRMWLNCTTKIPCNFDVFVVYYVNDTSIRVNATFEKVLPSTIGKFPTLYNEYKANPSFFSQYSAIYVLDDDILIDGNRINQLFEYRWQYDLWILQACRTGGTYNELKCQEPNACGFRYTNFVEVGTALFRTDKLELFFKDHYCGDCLASYGVDFWYMHSMGYSSGFTDENRFKAAVVDSVPSTNPDKSGKISGSSSWRNIKNDGPKKFKKIKKKYSFEGFSVETFSPNATICKSPSK